LNREGVGFPGNAEEMGAFFDARATGYEDHMRNNVDAFEAFYAAAIDAIPTRSSRLRVLDLGVGTGLELDRLFARYPEAQVTAMDLSEGMLSVLRAKPRPWQSRLALIHDSFLTGDFPSTSYDVVLSVMALHHWTPEIKAALYRRIRSSLVSDGTFVNADYIESKAASDLRLDTFRSMGIDASHERHIDLPLPPDHEKQLLLDAGFRIVRLPYCGNRTAVFAAS